MVNLEWNMTQKPDPTLLLTSNYLKYACFPQKIRYVHVLYEMDLNFCTHVLHVYPETLPPGGAFYFHRIHLVMRSFTAYTCMHVSKKSAQS